MYQSSTLVQQIYNCCYYNDVNTYCHLYQPFDNIIRKNSLLGVPPECSRYTPEQVDWILGL